jgi:hypothetical protein
MKPRTSKRIMSTGLAITFISVTAAGGVAEGCGGDVAIGSSRDPLAQATELCAPEKCANMIAACALPSSAPWGSTAPAVVNQRCVKAPYAGHGSSPPDACQLDFECVAPGDCPMSKCGGQDIAWAAPSNASDGGPPNATPCNALKKRCVPHPSAGQGSLSVGACMLKVDCIQ